jgi:hypothetical protein
MIDLPFEVEPAESMQEKSELRRLAGNPVNACIVKGCPKDATCHHWGIGCLCREHDKALCEHNAQKTPEQRQREFDYLIGRRPDG